MTEVFSVAFLKGPVHPLNWGAGRPESVCVDLLRKRGWLGPVWDLDSCLFYEADWLEGAGLMR